MRLGNRMHVLSTYACDTLLTDSGIVARWLNTLRGGLKMVAGSHGKVYASYWTDEVGEDYADNLAHKWTVWNAWRDGNWDTYTTQDVAVLATGTNKADCESRRNNLSAYNKGSFPRRKDGEIGYMCWFTRRE